MTDKPYLPPQRSPAWSLHYDYVEDYAFWDKAFTPDECDRVSEVAKTYAPMEGTIFSESGHAKELHTRKSTIAFLSPDQLEWFYHKLSHYVMDLNGRFFRFDLWGLFENIQYTQYVAPDGKYDSHIDKATGAQIRKLSVVVQLSDSSDYEGGDLEILVAGESKPIKMNREKGTLIVFPSYVLHRVTPITKGVRNSAVAWIAGAPFR
jgi:PKHD-type hydroxylase